MSNAMVLISQNRKPNLRAPIVQTAVTIALDTKYLISQPPGTNSRGIYMFDNRVNNGSSNEGDWNCRPCAMPETS